MVNLSSTPDSHFISAYGILRSVPIDDDSKPYSVMLCRLMLVSVLACLGKKQPVQRPEHAIRV